MDKNAIKIAVDALRQKESELESQISGIRFSIKVLLSKIEGNENVYKEIEASNTNIVSEDTNTSKVRKTLLHHQRFMTTKEISMYIASILFEDQKLWSQKVSRAVHKLKNEIISFQVIATKKVHVWGFIDWISEDKIMDKYMYDEKAVK